MRLIDYYLLFGLLIHIGFLGLADWLGYNHLVNYGYHPSILVLAVLNIVIFIGIYYLIIRTLHQRIVRRRMARQASQQRSSMEL